MFYILFSVKIFASAPAPSPKCDVVGVIENVRFEAAYNNPCIRLNNCPTDVQTVFPDRYYLTVKVQSVAYREGDVTIVACNDLYQVGQSQEFLINKSAVNENDVFGVGQTISGTAISFGDKLFETYSIGLALRKTGETCGLDLTNGKMLPNCEAGLECKSPNGTRLVNGLEETIVGGNSVCVKRLAKEGEMCGGIAGIMCDSLMSCNYGLPDGAVKMSADASGTCVKNCTPRPACIDGVDDGSGNKVYCDPQSGVVYCPSVSQNSCVSFSDDFSVNNLSTNANNWKFWENGLGTIAVGNGNINIGLPRSNDVWSKMSLVESEKIVTGNFSSEITLVSRDADSTYTYFQFNNKKWDGNGSNGFGFRLLSNNLKTEVYGSNNPNNPGAQGSDVTVYRNNSVRLKLERIGSTVNMYYDLIDGQGYKLLRTFNNFNMDSGQVIFGVQHTGMENLAISATFDDYKQTCGGVSPLPTWVLGVKGDTNGDGKADLVDFARWKDEYLGLLTDRQLTQLGYGADFNKDGKVDLVDFSIWKIAYLELSI